FSVSGPFASGVPTDGGNLVLKARDLLRDALGGSSCPVHIHLEKRLPVASGIGGGSSDAAAALRALTALWDLSFGPQQLAELALALGADVPMCLVAKATHVRGIGEDVRPVRDLPTIPAVLVNPGVAVSTPAVFARLQQRTNPPLPPFPETDDWPAWLHQTRNDLQAPAIEAAPMIGHVLEALRDSGADFQRMSGSGATCFGLFSTAAAANKAAALLVEENRGWFVQPVLLS
ncbi:MAG TPA: 4-(cytidine 5'-diphospho)-2-C-methyl-D-erythritol kinase, partial [Tianweitania sediminis]|nr:4-(cytidine 5'-diphospho)-2-C-methyl-D-erythritol kinase [Tianweitania sediminis]